MRFDDLLKKYLGEFGRYQKLQLSLICLPIIFVAIHSLSWTFFASPVPHRCRLPGEDVDANYWTNSSLLHTIKCSESRCRYEGCHFASRNSCDVGYTYDNADSTYSAVQRWDIVCDRDVLKPIIQSSYYVGQAIGSIFFGYYADRTGRKAAYCTALSIFLISNVFLIFIPYWYLFALLRAVNGFAHPGLFSVGMTLGMELVGPNHRKFSTLLSALSFSLGQAILGTLAYLVRNYQHLQLLLTLPMVVFIYWFWLVNDSARWLIGMKRFEDANLVLQKTAKMNGRTLPDTWVRELEAEGKSNARSEIQDHSIIDLVRTTKIRTRTLALSFIWPVTSMIYYGMSMKTDLFGGDFYATFVIGGFSEIPALFILFALIDVVGRRSLLASGFFISSFCTLLKFVMPPTVHWLLSLSQFMLTKAAITLSYASLYSTTSELYPTLIRNTAMGFFSTMARFGAIAASYVSLWLVESVGIWALTLPFGTLALIAAFTVLIFIPETMNKPLPETVDDVESERR